MSLDRVLIEFVRHEYILCYVKKKVDWAKVLDLLINVCNAVFIYHITFVAQMSVQIVAWCHDKFNALVEIVSLISIDLEVLDRLLVKTEHTPLWIAFDRFYRVTRTRCWRWKHFPVLISALMKRYHCLKLLTIFNAKNASEVLHLPWIISHFSGMVMLNRKCNSEVDLVQFKFIFVVEDVPLENLGD